MYLYKFNTRKVIAGFTCKRGFKALIVGGHMLAVTSGWKAGGDTFVYRRRDGRWVGEWVDARQWEPHDWTHKLAQWAYEYDMP